MITLARGYHIPSNIKDVCQGSKIENGRKFNKQTTVLGL